MKKTIVALVITGFVAFTVMLAMTGADAVPRHSARYEQSCRLCHVNPSGGGMRTSYAVQYIIPEELSWGKLSEETMEALDPQVSNNLSVGADLRTFYFYSDDDNYTSNFFQMQGNVYLDFHLSEQMSLYFSQGMSQSYELFGSAYVLPWVGYVKVGRFMPAYGWRFADHTSYTREQLGFFPPSHTDVGVEVGIAPGRFATSFAVVNGNRGATTDNNRDVAAVLRAAYRHTISGVGLAAGVSGYHSAQRGYVDDTGGVFGYISTRWVTWVGEADWTRSDFTIGGHRTGLAMTHQVSIPVHRGADLLATYDFYDPDWNFKTGAKERFGAGASVMVNPFLSLEMIARQTDVKPGEGVTGDDFYEAILQFHFMY